MMIPGCLSILLTTMLAGSPPVDATEARAVTFKLQDFRGGWHALDDTREKKLVVLAFLGAECPLASLYAPRLAELAQAYDKKGWRSSASTPTSRMPRRRCRGLPRSTTCRSPS